MAGEDVFSVPQDLTLVGDAELQGLESSAVAEFDRLNGLPEVTPDALESLMRLTDDIDRIRAEFAARQVRMTTAAELQRVKIADDRTKLQARVHGASGDDSGGGSVALATSSSPETIAAATAQGVTAALVAALGEQGAGRGLTDVAERATRSLSEARRYAPAVQMPRPLLAVTAGVDIPGVARGAELTTIEHLVDAFHRRAKGLPVTRDGTGQHHLVASIRNEYQHTVDDRTKPAVVEKLIKEITSTDRQQALVAGGGWCAPPETRYNFFNVACAGGRVDLPTFGVQRGGIQFPVSPSLADVFDAAAFGGFSTTFGVTTVPFLWTEASDIATVTGDPNKPCVRVPCADYGEATLECYGVCVTEGNLTNAAFPEQTQNFLQLMMVAHERAMNGRFIATMASLSSACVTGGAFAASGAVYNKILSGVSLAATDYRARYGMCADDVLEVVIPQWVLEAIQADLALRTGTEGLLSVAKARIRAYFADRNIRPQFVDDWQVRGTGQFGNATTMTAWPTSVNIMVYAAGTFILGNGLMLDLGVVRDSALNAENDHTAMWTEECHLIARVGHESRCYTISGLVIEGDDCCA